MNKVTPVKLKESEMSDIKQLQSNIQQTLLRFGTLKVERLNLENAEKETEAAWINLQKTEKDLLNKILSSYGEGNLSLTDGTFTPSSTV